MSEREQIDLADFHKHMEHITASIKAERAIRKFKGLRPVSKSGFGPDLYAGKHIMPLLGYKNIPELRKAQMDDPNVNKTLEALAGPDGYALFKVLLVRTGAHEDE